FFQAEDGIRDFHVTGVQTCALPISRMTEFKFVQQPLRGIVVPLVTPLRDYDTLDVAGTERLIEHVIAGGVRGIFILGTTGEAPKIGRASCRERVGITGVVSAIWKTA